MCGDDSFGVTSVGALGIGSWLIFTHSHCNSRKNKTEAGEVRALEETESDIVPSVRRNISIIAIILPLTTSSSFSRPGKYSTDLRHIAHVPLENRDFSIPNQKIFKYWFLK